LAAKKGERPGGRQKGTPNKVTASLRDAVIHAAATVGEDGNGKNGLEGYLVRIARKDEKTFAGLLGRVIPLHVGGEPDSPLEHRVKILFLHAGNPS
jgi:hypothetical protein